MIQRRTTRAPLSMGQFATQLGTAYATPSQRHCARCKCRLSRYAAQTETTCAPCTATLHPWQPPTPRPGPATVCPECGGYKKAESRRCRRCTNPGGYSADRMIGRTLCKCGRVARYRRARCSKCARDLTAARRAHLETTDHERTMPNTGSYSDDAGTGKMKASGIAPAGPSGPPRQPLGMEAIRVQPYHPTPLGAAAA